MTVECGQLGLAGGAAGEIGPPDGRSIGALLSQARGIVGREGGRAAQLLLAKALDRDRSWVLAHLEQPLNAAQLDVYRSSFRELVSGEPLPYLLGEWEFWGRRFAVEGSVLIPRPETELMVEWALRLGQGARRILELGTGSGCVAVSLALELPQAQLFATDRSRAALRVAKLNTRRHAVAQRVQLVTADLAAPLVGTFDLLCANLPYIPSARLPELSVSGREPWLALDGGHDGLQLVRRALAELPRLLSPGGAALLELDPDQMDAGRRTVQRLLPAAETLVAPDLAGRDRLLVIQRA